MVVSVGTLICWRLILMFKGWQFPLANLSDEDLSEDAQLDIDRSLFRAPPCCMDKECSEKMRVFS